MVGALRLGLSGARARVVGLGRTVGLRLSGRGGGPAAGLAPSGGVRRASQFGDSGWGGSSLLDVASRVVADDQSPELGVVVLVVVIVVA